MAGQFPTTIDGTPEASAAPCDRCDRLFSQENITTCPCCGSELCADCLGADALGACSPCIEESGMRAARRPPHRIPVFLRQTALVPRRYHLVHGVIRATVGDQHVLLEAAAGEGLLVAPIEVVHGARRELAAVGV